VTRRQKELLPDPIFVIIVGVPFPCLRDIHMAISQDITNALNAVDADSQQTAIDEATVASIQAQIAMAEVQLATLQQNLVAAQAVVTADLAHQATDLASLETLLNTTYGPQSSKVKTRPVVH
jgi:hypothetical protein